MMATLAESGMSRWAFARAAGIPYTTLVHWSRRADAEDAPRLVPVEVERGDEAAIEVVVGDAVVRVRGGIDDALLVRVFRALRAC